MDSSPSSEMLVRIHRTKRRHVLEDSNLEPITSDAEEVQPIPFQRVTVVTIKSRIGKMLPPEINLF
jgi:hypothetical protein